MGLDHMTMQKESHVEDDGRMTAGKVQTICRENGGYNTKCLNEKLYLHFKGWPRIENLDEFTGARCVWLEGNGLQNIDGLQCCPKLRQIYLQQNCIKTIENLEGLDELSCINLSENFITKIENLGCLKRLETVQLNNNNIATLEDFEGIRECQGLRVIELSKNQIDDPAIVDVLASIPDLRLLKLDGNPVIRKISSYRKTMIVRLKNLTYLDDRPVFEEERLTAEAWARGGVEAEKMERQRQRAFKKAQEERRHKAFFQMVEEGKKERRAREKAETRRQKQQEVIDRSRGEAVQEDSVVENEEVQRRDMLQEELVNKLEDEMQQQKPSKKDGKRRTKCVIREVTGDTAAKPIAKTTITEVNETPQDSKIAEQGDTEPKQSVSVPNATKRRAKSRKDRLRSAMAAVEAERQSGLSKATVQVEAEKHEESVCMVSRFAQLSNSQIEEKLSGGGNIADKEDDEAELITGSTDTKSNTNNLQAGSDAPTEMWGTKACSDVLAKASEMESELDDMDAACAVADDMTALLDVDELD